MRRILFASLVLMLSLVPMAQAQEEAPLRIVATTTQASDLLRILTAGVPDDAVEITGLMGAGVDPHLYQPTEADISAMNAADAIVYSGLHLEGQFDTVFEALSERGIAIYALSKPVKEAGYIFGGFTLSEELTDVDDPHFWFDPRNWQLSVSGLAVWLAELDPTHAALYEDNARTYNEQLELLYAWGVEAMASVAEEQRVLVTSHDAFQYFGDAFGWEVRGLQGISTQDEAGVGDIQAIVDFVVTREIPVVFVESSVPVDAIEAVQEAAASVGWDVRLGVRELYSDAMGSPDAFGGTYIGMIAQNIITVLQSYGVDVPPWEESLQPSPPDELFELAAQSR